MSFMVFAPSAPLIANVLFHIFTGRNEVVAKVMFLHVSVILSTGGVFWAAPWTRQTPPEQADPPSRQTPWQADPLAGRPPSREKPLGQADPQGQADPPSRQTPPAGRTSPPSRQTPQQGDPPGPGRPLWQGEPPRPGRPPRQADPPSRENPPSRTRQTPPLAGRTSPLGPGRHPPREEDCSIRSMSGRYASYWNAFL